MSENYRFYVAKMAERRAWLATGGGAGTVVASVGGPALGRQLDELFAVVQRCEAIWALEERIEHQR